MTPSDHERLDRVIWQAWQDDYPPELAPADVKGRKDWRRQHLIELIQREFGND